MGSVFSMGWCCCEAACCVGCCAFDTACGCVAGQCAKASHIIMIAVMYLSAIIIGVNFPGWIDDTPEVDLSWGCADHYSNSCLLNQLVYRASAALMIVFGVIALGTYGYAPMHTGLWAIKYMSVYLIWFLFMFCKNHGFDKLANITRFLSFFWLCAQSLLVIELSFQLNDYIATNNSGGILVLTSGVFVVAGVWGCTILYDDYSGCDEGFWFVNTTVGLSVLAIGLSVVESVGVGLLPGTVIFAYTVFLCWYALLSSTDESCNPSAEESELESSQKSRAFWLVMGVTAICMGFMIYTGSKIITILTGDDVTSVADVAAQKAAAAQQPGMDEILTSDVSDKTPLKEQPKKEPDDDAADKDEGDAEGQTDANSACCCAGLTASKPSEMNLGEPKEETVFFHFLMLILIMYCTMTLTSWGRTDGAPEAVGSSVEPDQSMYIKICVQWLTFAFFFLACKVSYNAGCEDEADQCLFCWEGGEEEA